MTRTEEETTEIESPVPVGMVVDGCRVERIIAVRQGLHTLAEARAPSGERVTLKVLAAPLEGKELRRRVAKLATVQASIAHPHVLPLVGDGKDRECLCLAGAPKNAVTLADRLREGPLEAKEAVTLLSPVAGALETAHRRGLPHRALGPTAIIVTTENTPRALLTDFGITVPDAPGCALTGAIEDADYRSPEEIRGEAPAPESTVYSLACILVACLTGDPPYPYYRPLLALHAHLVEKPPRVSERNPDVPRELDEVVAKALAKDRRDRYASPTVFMRAVQRAVGVEAPIPGPSSARRRPVPRADKRPARRPAPEPKPVPAPARRPTSEPKAAPRPAARPAPEPTPAPRPAPEPRTAPGPARAPRPAPGTAAPAPAAGKSAQEAGAAAHAARSHIPEQGRRRTRRARGDRPTRGGWGTVRRLAPTWAGIALLASALAGFATGNGSSDESKAPAGATARVEQAPRQISDSSRPTVGPVVKRLDERRTAARRRLRAARRPSTQAEVATSLAAAYGDARRSLVRAPGSDRLEGRLADQLLAVERAYRRLAAAPRRGSDAWRVASSEVLERERDLELLLRTNRWT